MSFRDLKQNRQQELEKLSKMIAAQTSQNTTQEKDERFWYPEVDKLGNGFAIIRFLPAPEGEDSPTVRIFNRSFQGPTGKWYIENDLSTIGGEDPVYKLNQKLAGGVAWDSIPKHIKDILSKQKRKTTFIANVYIVKDPANPENEGKVFLYKYGVKIQSKINEKMNPTFEGEERVNPFDLWEGANFKIKIRKEDGFRNYNASEWEVPGPLLKDDSKLEEIYKSEHSLTQFIAPDQFKSKEELEAKLALVVGNLGSVKPASPTFSKTAEVKESKESVPAWEGDDEIDESFFEKLSEEVE